MGSAIDPKLVEQLTNLGMTAEDAVECLQECNNELDRAAEYYWNGDLQKKREGTKWDESAWDQPREGNTVSSERHYQNDWQTNTFHVQGNDVLAFDTKSGAQSRAPTPVSFRAGAGNINDNEDPELAQALQASMEGQWGPQETGVTGTHTSPVNPNFAPAPAGKHYDPNQWALMPAPRAETKEITRHPPPQLRKREEGAPAFLRNSLVSYTLSGLLTIMHAIPSAREAFLLRCYLQDDYGHHPKWWDGEKIQSPRIIEVEDERLRFAEAEEQLIELQRIMAFLDRTDRAYGCIDSLATMPRVQEQELTSVIATFFKSWQGCLADVLFDQNFPEAKVFTSFAHQVEPNGTTREQEFQVLEITTSWRDSTIYDALDGIIWSEDDNPVYIDFSDVFTVQLRTESNEPGSGIDISPIIYLDRYTKPWLATANAIKEKILAQKKKIEDIEGKEFRLKSFTTRAGSQYDPRTLLEGAIQHFGIPLKKRSHDEDISMESQPELPDPVPILKQMLRKLEKKIANLERQKAEAHEELQKLKCQYTSPDDPRPNDLPPLTAYTLRGVLAGPGTTYILVRNQAEAGQEPNEQWWCCQWQVFQDHETSSWDNSSGTWDDKFSSPKATRATEEEVLLAAKTQGDTVLAVYANDRAFRDGNPSLPEVLKAFVDQDNAAFVDEMSPPSAPESLERKRRGLEDEETGAISPKRSLHSTRSSATLGANTPAYSSPADTADLPEMEMTERTGVVSPIAKAALKVADTDEDMPDVEHIENGEETKGG